MQSVTIYSHFQFFDYSHSHLIPMDLFPFHCSQLPFIPISSSLTIPIPISFPWTCSHSHAVDRNIMNLLAIPNPKHISAAKQCDSSFGGSMYVCLSIQSVVQSNAVM